MKKFLQLMVALILLPASVYGADRLFEMLDKDKDGEISQQEFLDAAEKTFDKLDRDGNGHLDSEELKALAQAERDSWLDEMDKDKDGRIKRNEFQKEALSRFSTADADQNRYLDSREWSKWETRQRIAPLLQFSF